MSDTPRHWYLNNKKMKVLIPVLVWVILIVLPNILNKYRLESMGGIVSQKERKFIQLDSIMYVYWIGVYYCNSLVLVPRLLLKGRYVYYISIILTLLCLTIFVDIGIRMLVGIGVKGVLQASIPIICYFRFPIFLLIIAAGIAFTAIETERK
jgi:two-component system LytT family sensor kinase